MNIKALGPGKIIALIFISLGIIFCLSTVFISGHRKEFQQQAVLTTAVITDIETVRRGSSVDHYVYVTYHVRGQPYNGRLNYYTSSMYVGKEVDIYYSLQNPANFRGDTGNILEYIFGGLGGLFLLIGLASWICALRKKSLKARLMQEGRRVDAEITDVQLNTSFTYNGRHPYIIICQWIDPTGNLHEFKSSNIWFNPVLLLENRNITSMPVYYDAGNPRRYHMDIRGLDVR